MDLWGVIAMGHKMSSTILKQSSIANAWALLDPQERRNSFKVLGVMVLGAFASAVMVGSVFPFLSVLADPDLIHENSLLAWAYATGGFSSDYGFLTGLGLGSISIILLSNLLLILQTWAVVRYTQMRVHSISQKLLLNYLAQPYEFFLGRHSGAMSTNILSETQQVVGQFIRPLAELISATLTVFAVLLTLLIINPLVASVVLCAFAGLYGGIMLMARRYVRRLGKQRAQANEDRFRIVSEALGGVKDIKLIGREATYLNRYSLRSLDMARAEIGVNVLSQAPRYAIQIIAFGGIILLCILLLNPGDLEKREALGGILPLVGLLAFAGQRLMPELQKLYQSLTTMTSGAAALHRVHEDLFAGKGVHLDRSQPEPMGLRHNLTFEGLSYTYPGAEVAGLSNVNFTIQAGERIGVVGTSGAGKTTLADIILGLLVPQAGTMRADGQKVMPGNLRAWQKTVGYVPQDIFLTDATLAENIALGLPAGEIDQNKVERAARIAQLHDFAKTKLQDGYDTRIGERGVLLSGGQRQRIGIARALYHNADLIVFDEATSALDNLTERDVMASVKALPGEKTIVMIAHRLSTVRVCDKIILMEAGQVAAIGSWQELLSNNDAFRALADVT
jgi:ABC-type bacteriocin/lantibiotic exporter with double-glycine peptidase domain